MTVARLLLAALAAMLLAGCSTLGNAFRDPDEAGARPVAGAASIPSVAGAASIPSVAGAASIPSVAGAASIPSVAGAASIPSVAGAASIPSVAGAASIPSVAGAASIPSVAGAASIPSVAGAAATPPVAGASAAQAAVQAAYRLDVDAPVELGKLLVDNLDLGRFQETPATDRVDEPELARLMQAAPAQARGLLETEGYFNAVVTVEKLPPAADGLPTVRLRVVPGPRSSVESVSLDATGDLQAAANAGDTAAAGELQSLRSAWTLAVGDPFRQAAWTQAKGASIAKLRADGYAAAQWQETHAQVDGPGNTVRLRGIVASGPLYRLGPIRVNGLQRYGAASVTRLATFGPGTPYSEKLLLDFQERLQKLGLFAGASVVLDGDPATSQAAPVVVEVREQPLQQATFGIGFSTDTGARLSLDHTQRRFLGSPWVARNKFQLGPDNQAWTGELNSYPLDNLWRNIVGGSASRLKAAGEIQTSFSARVGQTQETPDVDRLYYAEATDARVEGDTLDTEAKSVSANYHWLFRHLDNPVAPIRGTALSVQTALGYGDGRSTPTTTGGTATDDRGPFARLYARLTWYRPLPGPWFASVRVEAGQVFTVHPVGVPDTFLFRAGGEDSVRGYGYRTLGPTVSGSVASGRSLATASAEVARPFSSRLPDYLWAVFVDAGNAADRWSQLHPAVGYGAGLRWRSPVGPLRIDLAYGQREQRLRVDFSVGVVF